jgi:Carboxypeptidase regulatory-like domain
MKLRIFVVMLLVVMALPVMADPPQTVITVAVKNDRDKPIDNATVILDFLGSRQFTKLGKRKPIHWEMHTNQQGLAKFPSIPQGTIQVQVVASRYQTAGKQFDINAEEKRLDITLNRPQAQYSAHPPLQPADAPKR